MEGKKPILNDLIQRLKLTKAEDIMTKKIITTTPDTYLADVAEILIKCRISGLPVIDAKEKLVGIVTASDLFILMDMIKSGDVMEHGHMAVPNPTAEFAMSTDVITVQKTVSLNEIIALMKYRNIHTLPVYDGDTMVGVIGRRDIYKNFYRIVKELHL